MKTVLLDTNVVVSALVYGGKPWDILELALRNKVSLFTSQPLLEELAEILRHKFDFSEERVYQTLEFYRDLTTNVVPQKRV